MYTPSKEDFLKEYATKGNMVPIYKTMMADTIPPVLALGRLGKGEYSFLLESVTGGENIGRYSFLGTSPSLVFSSRENDITTIDFAEGDKKENTTTHTCPLDKLSEIMQEYKAVDVPDLPKFCGGAVGYLAYDAVRQVEKLPNRPKSVHNLPDIYFCFYNSMIVFDHVMRTMKIVAHADMREKSAEEAYDAACKEIDKICNDLSSADKVSIEEVPVVSDDDPKFSCNFKKEDFEAAVSAAQEYIKAGDIFQVVLSQRFSMKTDSTPFELYRTLRTINPSPYMLYLTYPEFSLVGSSPEVMVRVEDDTITLRPIAGTRKRGKDKEEDAALAADLLADEKELAEHTMLLDLGRNDVGRVSEYGSVKVTDKMVIENYSHVMHIVSNVEGKLREGMSAFDTLKASLPAGTVSGAPKVRAMEIIDELEPDERGPYAGAVGYIGYNGNLDTCIALRTIILKDGVAHVQSGAGIVLDSVPESEYFETRSKARALLKAIAASK